MTDARMNKVENSDPNLNPAEVVVAPNTVPPSAAPAVVDSKVAPNESESEIEIRFHKEIKADLLVYCRELATDLDQKQGIAKKFFQVQSSSSHVYNVDEKSDLESRQTFINDQFEEFYQDILKPLDKFTIKDIKYYPRDNAEFIDDFVDCFAKLNEACFYDANGRALVFWTGDLAQIKANELVDRLSDSTVPSISVLSKLGVLLKEKSKLPGLSDGLIKKYRELSDKIFALCSALLARQSVGTVHMYSSASNAQEDHMLIVTRGNFNWDYEIGHIRAGLGDKGKLLWVKFNHIKGCWNEPVDVTNMQLSPVDIAKRRKSEDKDCPTPRTSTSGVVNSAAILDRLAGPGGPVERARERVRSKSRHSVSSDASGVPSSPPGSPLASPPTLGWRGRSGRFNLKGSVHFPPSFSLGGNTPPGSPVLPGRRLGSTNVVPDDDLIGKQPVADKKSPTSQRKPG